MPLQCGFAKFRFSAQESSENICSMNFVVSILVLYLRPTGALRCMHGQLPRYAVACHETFKFISIISVKADKMFNFD